MFQEIPFCRETFRSRRQNLVFPFIFHLNKSHLNWVTQQLFHRRQLKLAMRSYHFFIFFYFFVKVQHKMWHIRPTYTLLHNNWVWIYIMWSLPLPSEGHGIGSSERGKFPKGRGIHKEFSFQWVWNAMEWHYCTWIPVGQSWKKTRIDILMNHINIRSLVIYYMYCNITPDHWFP